MTNRIKWDKYETALLIDGFWRIEKAPEKKKAIITELSQSLRARAVVLGVEIDDVFRNENGISMQLVPIAHAFFPQRPTLTTSAMFESMVTLYKLDKTTFDAVLNVAKLQVRENVQLNETLENKVSFILWLFSNCPSELQPQVILKALEEGAQKCIRLRYSNKVFWEMASIEEFDYATERLLFILKKSRFRIWRSKALNALEKSIGLYKQFLIERASIRKPQSMATLEEQVKKSRHFQAIDRTEAVFLIDLYLDTVAQKGDWTSVEKTASTILRKRAVLLDQKIDDAFRNVSFVKDCFSNLTLLFQEQDNGNCHPVFRELVGLKLKDPSRYASQSLIVHAELERIGVLSLGGYEITRNQSDTAQHVLLKGATVVMPNCEAEEDSQTRGDRTIQGVNEQYVQKVTVPTPSMDDGTYLADQLFFILKTESKKKKYGLSLFYLSYLTETSEENVKEILESAEWASNKGGRFFFDEERSNINGEYCFANPVSLAFTKPKKLLYFDDVISEATTWRQLFFDFMKNIYEDYPHVINSIVGKDKSPFSELFISSVSNIKQFRVPGEFAPGLVTELDQHASSITKCIERILELCNVDRENVRIFFERKNVLEPDLIKNDSVIDVAESAETPCQERKQATERHYARDDKENFYRWLINDQQLAEAASIRYVSAIRKAEKYASSHISSLCKLFCDDKEIIEFTVSALSSDDLF